MSCIVSSTGIVKAILTIILDRLKEDGTIENLVYEINDKSQYEIIAMSDRDGMLYTLKGMVAGFGCDIEHAEPYRADYIMLDDSTCSRSKLTKVLIRNIRAITEIKQLV